MKDGLFFEDGELIYYKNGAPKHAGVVKIDGDIYYISSGGRAVKGEHAVHRSMSHGILKRGVYTFGEDYKLVEGSYVAPDVSKVKIKKKVRIKKKKKKIKTKSKVILASCIVLFAAMLFVYMFEPNIFDGPENPSDDQSAGEKKAMLISPVDAEVLLCSEEAKKLYDGELSIADAIKSGSPYKAFKFGYGIYTDENGKLLISEKSDFSESMEYVLPYTSRSITIDNLKTGTTYYYRASCKEDVFEGSFKTVESTRYLYIPGANNVRDIGGIKTLDGKTLKQGYIIRGSEIDGLVESSFFLADENVDSVMNQFGFVYDFDLRGEVVFVGSYVSRFGNDVRHRFYNSPAYGNIFNQTNMNYLKEIFSDLAKEENYPMYLHCTHGADRTGTIVFLLQGLLNVSEEDMVREYRLTGFYNSSYATNTHVEVILAGLSAYDGETVNQKIENFLLTGVGITKEEIESIKNIMLED